MSLLKTFLSIIFVGGLLYAARLALIGELEMGRILYDVGQLREYIVQYIES